MMDIDWSKAPADATHFNPHSQGFMKISGDEVWLWCQRGDEDIWYLSKGGFGGHEVRAEDAIPRPPAWNGEGKPPVGTVCDFQDGLGDWHEVEITAIARNGICFVEAGKKGECYVTLTANFRPIRTAEQIAAEERATAISEIAKASGLRARDGAQEVAERLYEAGYRKFEIVEGE